MPPLDAIDRRLPADARDCRLQIHRRVPSAGQEDSTGELRVSSAPSLALPPLGAPAPPLCWPAGDQSLVGRMPCPGRGQRGPGPA
jgi:hypothetical protein